MKILCPDGTEKTIEEVKEANYLPKPIIEVLVKGRDKKDKKGGDKPWFGVTRLTSCLRKTYYDLTEEIPIPLEKLWIFARGQAVHSLFQRSLPKENVEILRKKEFSKFGVLAYIDVIHDGVLYELKTTANVPEQPQTHHILQAQAYFSLLSPEEQKQIKKIVLVYFSLHKIKHFEIPKRNVLSWLEARGTILAEALRHGVPPNKEESWLCEHCEYYDFCMGKKPTTYFPRGKKETNSSESEGEQESHTNLKDFF